MTTAWHAFREEVKDAELAFGQLGRVWYRGQQRVHYKLVPSLYRLPDGIVKERGLYDDFVQGGGRKFVKHVFPEAGPEVDQDWMTLFDMQHYGIPTRLLDWTETFGVALAFALLDRWDQDSDPAAIFLLCPEALNRKENPNRDRIEIGVHENYKYKQLYWKGDPMLPIKPVAIETPIGYWNDRMYAQRGRFTIHGTNEIPLEEQCPGVVQKVVLPDEAVNDARGFLRDAGITPVDLYPDVAGLAIHIRTKHFGKQP